MVFHLHMHVMPRHDGVALLPAASRKEDLKVLEDQATRIIAALSSFSVMSSGLATPEQPSAWLPRSMLF